MWGGGEGNRREGGCGVKGRKEGMEGEGGG